MNKMEPEMLQFQDVYIKQEPYIDAKQEQLECELKHEEISPVSNDDDNSQNSATEMKNNNAIENEDLVLKFEEGPMDVTLQTIKSEGEPQTDTKQEQLDCDLKHPEENAPKSEDDDPIMLGTSGVLGFSGNNHITSSPIPNLHYEYISGSNVSESQNDIMNFCSYACDFRKNTNQHLQQEEHKDKQSTILGPVQIKKSTVQVQEDNGSKLTHRQHICNICNKCFTHRCSLYRHLRTHKHEEPYTCKICNKSFTLGGNFKRHMVTHTDKRPYSCEICNKSFTQHGDVKRHLRTHTGQRPFSCEICNKSFTQQGNLKTHMLTHTGQQSYICEICNKLFTRRGVLKAHIQTHTGHRPYTCEVCNKSFIERGILNKHMRIHSGQRTYSCEICNKSFTLRGDLKRHMLTHTGHRPYSCEICNKSFTQRAHLKRHMPTHKAQ